MKSFATFLAYAVIPAWWLLWVWQAILGGYVHGFLPSDIDPNSLPYPWFEVSWVSGWMGIEAAILYAILRPATFGWSIVRAVSGFITFAAFASCHFGMFTTDQPGYAYVPSIYALVTTAILAVLLALTLVREIAVRVWHARASNKAA